MKRILSYLLIIVICCSAMGFATGCDSVDLSTVNSKIEQLEKDLADAKAATDKIAKLEKDLAEAVANGTSSTDKITKLEKDLAEAVANGTSSQAEIDKLKADLAAAIANGTSSQAEIDKLKEALKTAQETVANLDAQLNGKFDYNLNETITHYIKGQKIFDLEVIEFDHQESSGSFALQYNVRFESGFNSKPNTVFTATLYDPTENSTYLPTYNREEMRMVYSLSGIDKTAKTIVIFYYGTPIAKLVLTATPFVPPIS